MRLFPRNRKSPPSLQIPEQLAQEAADKYGHQDFAGALECYASAIDKTHTMSVIAARASRIRQPGLQDAHIIDGFVSALGASLAMNPDLNVDQLVRRTINYLGEIAQEAHTVGGPEHLYLEGMTKAEQAHRLGTGRELPW